MNEWELAGLDKKTYRKLVQIVINFNRAGINISLDDLLIFVSLNGPSSQDILDRADELKIRSV